jgi:pilus assembly protein Flp/PilA
MNMETGMRKFQAFLRDDSGATAIEYGLIAAGISVAILVAVNSVGTGLKDTFNVVKNNLAGAGQ